MIIDDLVVTLGLDPKKFNKGRADARAAIEQMRKDAQRVQDEIDAIQRNSTKATQANDRKQVESLKDVLKAKKRSISELEGAQKAAISRDKEQARATGEIKAQTLGLVAAVIGAGGIGRFVTTQTANLSAMGRSAQAMGMHVADLSAFQQMIQRNGGSADEAAGSMRGLTQEIERFKITGQTAMLPAFSKIGANVNDDALGVYKKFAKWSEGKDAKLVTYQGQQLGLDEASINEAMKGLDAVNRDLAQSKKTGVPDEEHVKRVQALQGSFFRLRQGLTADANAILYDASPALSGFLNLVAEGTERVPGLVSAVIGLGVALGGLGTLKTVLGLARVAGIAPKAAGAAEAALGAAPGVAGRLALGVASKVAFPVALGYALLKPTAANVGEDAAVARMHAATNVKRKAAGLPPLEGDAVAQAKSLIKKREGFISQAKWDVNHHRAGYGSDTSTDPTTGAVRTITPGAKVTRAEAEADLHRRITQEFMPKAAAGAGSAWAKMSATMQAVLTDVAYNYGSLPKDIAAAARTGDAKTLAGVIERHKGDNKGVNAARRAEEARLVLADAGGRPGAAQTAAAGAPASSTHTELHIGALNVQTQATDAAGMARELPGALRRSGIAVQANGGLR